MNVYQIRLCFDSSTHHRTILFVISLAIELIRRVNLNESMCYQVDGKIPDQDILVDGSLAIQHQGACPAEGRLTLLQHIFLQAYLVSMLSLILLKCLSSHIVLNPVTSVTKFIRWLHFSLCPPRTVLNYYCRYIRRTPSPMLDVEGHLLLSYVL